MVKSATSQAEMQSNHKQNYKQKSTTKVPNFRSFQTREKCNLTNRITIKSQAGMQSNHKQNERKREKEKKEAKKRNKSKRKILKEVKNIYIYYNNTLENQSIIIISVGKTRPRQTDPNKFF